MFLALLVNTSGGSLHHKVLLISETHINITKTYFKKSNMFLHSQKVFVPVQQEHMYILGGTKTILIITTIDLYSLFHHYRLFHIENFF